MQRSPRWRQHSGRGDPTGLESLGGRATADLIKGRFIGCASVLRRLKWAEGYPVAVSVEEEEVYFDSNGRSVAVGGGIRARGLARPGLAPATMAP